LVVAVAVLILTAAGIYLGFFRGGSSEQLSMSFVDRVDLVPGQPDASDHRFQIEALIRLTSDHDIGLTFVTFNLTRRCAAVSEGGLCGDGIPSKLSIGNAEPVPPGQPINMSSGFTLGPGVGQLFYVTVPDAKTKRWFEPGSTAIIEAGSSDGRTWSSQPTTDFFYAGA
jgi:hypothetical protein